MYLEVEKKLSDHFWEGLGNSIDRNNINEVMADYIGELRSALSDGSETAQAIDQNRPWVVIAKLAFKEKLESFAEVLYIADRLRFHASSTASENV